MSREPLATATHLTVMIRDDSPMVLANDSPTYRSVTVALSDEQRQALARQWTHSQGANDFHEAYSVMALEARP